MVRLGMDVEVVETVGRQLKQQGSAISALVRTVDAQVQSAGTQWWGAKGKAFVHQWQSVHRPALLRLAQDVVAHGDSAIRNAADQRAASASGQGPSTSMDQLLSFVSSADAQAKRFGLAPALGIMGLIESLTGTYRGKSYGDIYRKVFGGSDFMHYNRTLQHWYSPEVAKFMDLRAVKGIGTAGNVFGVVTAIAGIFETSRSPTATAGDHVEAVGMTVGAGLRTVKNPVAYLAGVNVSLWSMVANEASKQNWSRDWSPKALGDLGAYMVNYPGQAMGTIGQSALEAGKKGMNAL